MSTFADFLKPLLEEGRAVLTERPHPSSEQQKSASELLASAFMDFHLQVAGPLLNWDAGVGVAAAELVWHACWYLVNHADPGTELAKRLVLPAPTTPASHLSADLTLRYLPTVHRRARAFDPSDELTTHLATLMRQWPLSGVLSDVEDEPTTDLEFGGHKGLLLLYAERWVRQEKQAWKPQGKGWEFVELVRAKRIRNRD